LGCEYMHMCVLVNSRISQEQIQTPKRDELLDGVSGRGIWGGANLQGHVKRSYSDWEREAEGSPCSTG
jgi:hypothetical protein